MDFRQMRYFIAVAEDKHFGRAAIRLNIAQQPLSLAISRLEERLGVKLLTRTTRSVELTRAGQVYLHEARLALAQLERATNAARASARLEQGLLRIGYPGGTLHGLPQNAVRGFLEAFPGTEIALRVLAEPELIPAVLNENLDVAVTILPVENEDLRQQLILTEPLLLAVPDSHVLAARSKIVLKDVKHETIVAYPRALKPGFHDLMIQMFAQAGFSPVFTQEAVSEEGALDLVAAGLGLALVTQHQQTKVCKGVTFKNVQERPKLDLGVVWRVNKETQLLLSFVEKMLECSSSATVKSI
jgi:DNA-binding transcriptional LysR family regulator